MSSGVTFSATVYCPGATLTPTITPTSTVTPTVTASITPTLSVTPSPSALTIDDCNTSVHEMNAYDSGHIKQYYVDVGTTSGTLSVTVEITSSDDLQDCLLFTYGDVILISQCIGGSGHTVGTILNINIPYTYDSEIGTKVKVVQTTNTLYCCGDTNAENFITTAALTGTTKPDSIRNLVANLKYNNLWTKFLCIHPLVGGTQASHVWNLITQDNFNLSPTTPGAVHNENGISWDSSSMSRARVMEFTPATSGLLLNSTHISHYNYFGAGFEACEMGVSDTGTDGLYITTNGQTVKCAVNGVETAAQSMSSNFGFLMANRSDANNVTIYRNGNSVGGQIANPSGSLCSSERMYYGLRNHQSVGILPSHNIVEFYSIGYGMTATEAKIFYRIVQHYQRRLSRNVGP
jgi:hypothetical protein